MATPQIKAVRGTSDILPDSVHGWQFIESAARGVFSLFNFREIRTPVFESTELFVKNIGETTEIVEKEMYSFSDKKGRDITLRPEGTACVVRALLEHNLHAALLPQKLYYIGPMFRYERPQEGRQRQFHQIGAEVLGSHSLRTDFELIAMLAAFFGRIGLKNFVFSLNNVGTPESKARYTRTLVDYLGPAREKFCPDCRRRLDTNPLRVLDCKVETCREALGTPPRILDSLDPELRARFDALLSLLEREKIPCRVNDRLVRGLDYYTQTVYEVNCPLLGAKDAIAGGGRYDNLVSSLGGPALGSAGFGVGMERVLLALEREGALPAAPAPDVFVAFTGQSVADEAARACAALRAAGVSVESPPEARSLKSQFKAANSWKARHLLLVGEEELAGGNYKLKDMASGTETLVPCAALSDWAPKLKNTPTPR